MTALRIGSSLLLLLAATVNASAAPPYDGSRPMQCAIETVMICSDPTICVLGTAQTVNLPSVLNVDVDKKLISGAATGRTIKIAWVNRQGGRLLVGGSELGGGWTMAVAEATGARASAVIVRGGGLILFGNWTSSWSYAGNRAPLQAVEATIGRHAQEVDHDRDDVPHDDRSRHDQQPVVDPGELEHAHDARHPRIHALARPPSQHRDQIRQ